MYKNMKIQNLKKNLQLERVRVVDYGSIMRPIMKAIMDP